MSKKQSGTKAEIPTEPTPRTIASRENGGLGGEARATRNDHVVLQEWSSRGGKKVLQKYGREYFVALRKKRKHYPSYWKSPLTQRQQRSAVNAENGRHGGDMRASLYSPEHFREWGRLGGESTRARHGTEFFREIRKMREYYPKGYMTRKTKARIRENALQQAKTSPNFGIAELWRAVARYWEP
jgi:general stress protein YciG